MPSRKKETGFAGVIDAALGLLPLLDRSLWRIRYSQGVPGLSPLEYRILEAACHHRKVRVGQLGGMVGLEISNSSKYVKGLVGKGLLKVEAEEGDRRVHALAMTKAGQAALAEAEGRIRAEAAGLLARLGKDEAEALETAMCDLARALGPLVTAMEAGPGQEEP